MRAGNVFYKRVKGVGALEESSLEDNGYFLMKNDVEN